MNYKELQAKAKKLGLKYVGVSKEDLIKNITEAKKENAPEIKEKPASEEDSSERKDAVVYSGKHKVRTYTYERHGEDYVKLAEQYISHPDREDYRIELEGVVSRVMCPYCNKKFRID